MASTELKRKMTQKKPLLQRMEKKLKLMMKGNAVSSGHLYTYFLPNNQHARNEAHSPSCTDRLLVGGSC